MTYQDFFSKYIYDRRADKLCSTRFGAIYKATQRKKGREVLLRLMPLDENSGAPSLLDEVQLANSLPEAEEVVRYTEINRFEEATGLLDCAIMPFYPLGNLTKVLEDWKLNNGERHQLRDSILAAARFLRSNNVPVGDFNPDSVFISQDDDERLIPHLIDIGFTEAVDEATFASQVSDLLPVEPEEPVVATPESVEVATPDAPVEPEKPETPLPSEPEPETVEEVPVEVDNSVAATPEEEARPAAEEPVEEEPVAEEEPMSEEEIHTEENPADDEEQQSGSNARKWRLLAGVAVTWAAIIALIYAVHVQRNASPEEPETAPADSVTAPVYPADEFVKEEAARADSIAKAREDSIAAFKADSAAYMKKIAAEKEAKAREREEARKREAEKAPAAEENTSEHQAPAAPAAPVPVHPAEPAEE